MKLKEYLYKTLIKNDEGIIALKNRINIIYDLLKEKLKRRNHSPIGDPELISEIEKNLKEKYERYINTTHKKGTRKKS